MSAKSKIQVEWQDETGQSIPVNSRLSAEAEFYPFAFVSMEEFFQERETFQERESL